MDFDGNFRRVGSANIESAKAYIQKLSDGSWYQDTDAAHEAPHGNGAQVLYLVHDDKLRHDQPLRHPALEVFATAIRPILAIAADHFDASPEGQQLTQKYGAGYFVRARFLRVVNGFSFTADADTAVSELHAHRVHVPIASNDNARFTVGEESLSLPEGEIYEINNLRRRRIDNSGNTPCVHLVLDYVLDRQLTG